MGVAVGAHDIKRVQSLMDELLVLVERGDTEPLLKTPKSVVVDYLELCERELRLLVEQEELERTRQRLHGNEQMKQVVDKLHVPVIDIESINLLLSDVDKSYRRARDKRSKCIPCIRHKATADALMTQASYQFEAGAIDEAIAIARSAQVHFQLYRQDPTYQRAQLLLSLSENETQWDQQILQKQLVHDEESNRCFSNITEHFRSKAQEASKLLLHESKKLATRREFSNALVALTRCEKYYTWLQEPLPPTIVKWKRQLRRQRIAHELETLRDECHRYSLNDSMLRTQLLQWDFECSNEAEFATDLIESDVNVFLVSLFQPHSTILAHPAAVGAASWALIERCLDRVEFTRIFPDTALTVSALIRLASIHDQPASKVRILDHLCGTVHSKQSVHMAIHKCRLLESLCVLREENIEDRDVIQAILKIFHLVLSTSFPVFLSSMTERNVFHILSSVFARYYKDVPISTVFLQIMKLTCQSECAPTTINGVETGLCATMASALQYHSQSLTTESVSVSIQIIDVLHTLCKVDYSFAIASDSTKVPRIVSSVAISLTEQNHLPLSADIVEYFDPKRFYCHLQERSLTTTAAFPSKTKLRLDNISKRRYKRLTRFGIALMIEKQCSFYMVDVCSISRDSQEIYIILLQVGTCSKPITFAFPTTMSIDMIGFQREITQRQHGARNAFFRSIFNVLEIVES